jgi:hypothetical protein
MPDSYVRWLEFQHTPLPKLYNNPGSNQVQSNIDACDGPNTASRVTSIVHAKSIYGKFKSLSMFAGTTGKSSLLPVFSSFREMIGNQLHTGPLPED